MSLLTDAYKQAIVLQAYSQLGSNDDVERSRAMAVLRECGDASLWALRLASRQAGQPRIQFGAAIVLHWLGNSQGMMTLTEALKWRLPSEPALAPTLEASFLTIGSPDAVFALLTVWNMLPDWGDQRAVLALICRIWSSLKNPAALAPLIARASSIPDLFEQTIPEFGEMAITPLGEMTREREPGRRQLALRALRHIPDARSFSALIPLLYDSDPIVRSEAPAALNATASSAAGVAAVVREITRAVREGFVTSEAVVYLIKFHPEDLYESLNLALERGNFIPTCEVTSDVLILILQTLSRSPLPSSRLAPVLCPLLEANPQPKVSVEIVRTLSALGPTQTEYDDVIREALWKHLAAPASYMREQVACALARFGEPLGRRILLFLDECTPNGSLLSKIHVILRGGPDAGQAATQAVQQVSQWITRVSREGATRLQGQQEPESVSISMLLHEPRVPVLLGRMLSSILDACSLTTHLADREDKTAFTVTLIRAVTRLGMPVALPAWSSLLQALHFSPGESSVNPANIAEMRETIHLSAVEAWIELYGGSAFPVFLEALYLPDSEINRTAIMGLGRLGDARALPHLQPLASNSDHPLCAAAQQSLSLIKRTNPEMMTLLRGSTHSAVESGMLLRAASGNNTAHSADLLLRPTAQTQD